MMPKEITQDTLRGWASVARSHDGSIMVRADELDAVATRIEELGAALQQVDDFERASMWERCPDCDHGCKKEDGCAEMEKAGGSPIQQIVRKVLKRKP